MKKSLICRLVVAFTLVLLSCFSARAVTLDLTAKIIKPGGSVTVSSTDAVPGSLIYVVNISATGSSTGSFVPVLGIGNFATEVDALEPGLAENLLSYDLADLTGKFPVTLGQQQGETSNIQVLTTSGTDYLTAKGHASLAINKKGIVTAKLTGIGLSETMLLANNKRKAVKFSGTYTVTSGEVSVEPLVATSSSAQPIVIALLNTHFALGATYDDENVYPGNDGFARLARGGSVAQFFVVQNNGPATDTLTLAALHFPTGTSEKYYDGKVDVTAEVTGGGYAMSMASGAQKLIKVVDHVAGNVARGSDLLVVFEVSSTTDPSAVVFGGTQLFTH